MTFHAIFNLLIQSEYDWAGMLLPIAAYLGFRLATWKKQRAVL